MLYAVSTFSVKLNAYSSVLYKVGTIAFIEETLYLKCSLNTKSTGKLCLVDESLAKKTVAALARELEKSDSPAIRNNVVIVMGDLTIRYVEVDMTEYLSFIKLNSDSG